jgi:ammonium transporter, Amt family
MTIAASGRAAQEIRVPASEVGGEPAQGSRDGGEQPLAGAEREGGSAFGVDRYSRLVERSHDMIFTLDPEGTVTTANPGAERVLGLSPEEMVGSSFMEYITPGDLERAGALFVLLAAGAGFVNDEFELVAKDGRRVFVDVFAYPIVVDGRLVGVEGIARDVTERRELHEALTHQAFHDSLTGLPNRALFFNRVAQAVARAERGRSTVAVMLLDLDRFKLINDTLGHHVGDELLVTVAQRLSGVLRASEHLARLGGDEFAVILEDVATGSELELAAVARRMLGALAEPLAVGDLILSPTASIGISVAESGDTPISLMRDADSAMYQAKGAGRGRFSFFDWRQRARVQRDLELGAALGRAVQNDELLVHYQPIVSLTDGEVLAVEALARWLHPQWGWVSPAEFIPAAEKGGLIVPLGNWVLTEVARQAAAWRKQYPDALPLGVTVNASPQQLSQADFVPFMEALLSDHDISPGDLGIDITEHVFIDASAQLDENLAVLSKMGIRFSLDDFGTGYSALSSLMRFPLTALKIDRSFVSTLRRDSDVDPIASACINLARGLGLRSIAEGVENEEQADRLLQLGCDAAQGYYFAWPQPGSQLTEMLFPHAGLPQCSEMAAWLRRSMPVG